MCGLFAPAVLSILINAFRGTGGMAEINRKAWLVLDIVGMAVLLLGALGFIGVFDIGTTASTVIFGIGIFLVIESAIFIYLEGVTVRNEIIEIERREDIREAAASVSDDSVSGYILDLTEEHRILAEDDGTPAYSESMTGDDEEACAPVTEKSD